MDDSAAQRIAAAIVCVGLGYLALEYDSLIAGFGCFLATIASFD